MKAKPKLNTVDLISKIKTVIKVPIKCTNLQLQRRKTRKGEINSVLNEKLVTDLGKTFLNCKRTLITLVNKF